jgi:hypothetical protein
LRLEIGCQVAFSRFFWDEPAAAAGYQKTQKKGDKQAKSSEWHSGIVLNDQNYPDL